MPSVIIICDGSSRLINQKKMAAAAAILICNGQETIQKFKLVATALGEATNQQAEINAAILGLKQLKTPCKVEVLTDSKYVVETMKGNFAKKANLELWKELDRVANNHQIEWKWIKGHNPETSKIYKLQNLADKIAQRVAAKQGFPIDLKNESEKEILQIIGLDEN
jgi:ribonuclease HI